MTTTTVTVVTVVVDHAWSSLGTAAQRVQASITMFAPRTTERYFDVTLVGTISWPFIMRIQSVEHWDLDVYMCVCVSPKSLIMYIHSHVFSQMFKSVFFHALKFEARAP